MANSLFTDAELTAYRQEGFLLARSLFDAREIAKLHQFVHEDEQVTASAYGRRDATGAETKLALRNEPGSDLIGMFSRSPRIVARAEQILDGEVYHYHTKLNMKEPRIGGAWEWHQDYGYWYDFGCLYPLLVSCMIAIDPSNKENGCLQVLRASHQIGRINHGQIGDQTGADMQRVQVAQERLELVYVEMQPGDALFFDCNLLHRSDQNHSDQPRWTLICCYNAARNSPYKQSRHPRYTPLDCVLDDAVRQWTPP